MYDRHDINGGRQARIRIQDKKHPLKSFSEERDENWISQVCVHPGQKLGAVWGGPVYNRHDKLVPGQRASETRRENERVVSKYLK